MLVCSASTMTRFLTDHPAIFKFLFRAHISQHGQFIDGVHITVRAPWTKLIARAAFYL